jgi:hypothetical protein
MLREAMVPSKLMLPAMRKGARQRDLSSMLWGTEAALRLHHLPPALDSTVDQ